MGWMVGAFAKVHLVAMEPFGLIGILKKLQEGRGKYVFLTKVDCDVTSKSYVISN